MFTGADNDESREALAFLHSLVSAESLTEDNEEQIKALYPKEGKPGKPFIRAIFTAWSDPAAFGEASIRP